MSKYCTCKSFCLGRRYRRRGPAGGDLRPGGRRTGAAFLTLRARGFRVSQDGTQLRDLGDHVTRRGTVTRVVFRLGDGYVDIMPCGGFRQLSLCLSEPIRRRRRVSQDSSRPSSSRTCPGGQARFREPAGHPVSVAAPREGGFATAEAESDQECDTEQPLGCGLTARRAESALGRESCVHAAVSPKVDCRDRGARRIDEKRRTLLL